MRPKPIIPNKPRTVRFPVPLIEKLESDAKKAHRTFTQEVLYRLENSLDSQEEAEILFRSKELTR